MHFRFQSATHADNGGKVGQLDPKKKLHASSNTEILYYQSCMRIINKMDRAISDLVAKISSNSTTGHTQEDMISNNLLEQSAPGHHIG